MFKFSLNAFSETTFISTFASVRIFAILGSKINHQKRHISDANSTRLFQYKALGSTHVFHKCKKQTDLFPGFTNARGSQNFELTFMIGTLVYKPPDLIS